MKCPCCNSEIMTGGTSGPWRATSRLDNETTICSRCAAMEGEFVPRDNYPKSELMNIIWWFMKKSYDPPKVMPKFPKYRGIDEE